MVVGAGVEVWFVMVAVRGVVDSYNVRIRYRTKYDTASGSADEEERMGTTAGATTGPGTPRRARLTRDRVLAAALVVADAGGLGSLTIRSLATELGVKPMSVYYHVTNKDEILDALVDTVFGEIELPVPGGEWRAEMERRAVSAREVLPGTGGRSGCWSHAGRRARPTSGTTTPSSRPCSRRASLPR